MAERSAGGWVSRASGETASTRPAASATDTISGGRVAKAAITRAWASRTVSIRAGGARLQSRVFVDAGDDRATGVARPQRKSVSYASYVPDLPPDLCRRR